MKNDGAQESVAPVFYTFLLGMHNNTLKQNIYLQLILLTCPLGTTARYAKTIYTLADYAVSGRTVCFGFVGNVEDVVTHFFLNYNSCNLAFL